MKRRSVNPMNSVINELKRYRLKLIVIVLIAIVAGWKLFHANVQADMNDSLEVGFIFLFFYAVIVFGPIWLGQQAFSKMQDKKILSKMMSGQGGRFETNPETPPSLARLGGLSGKSQDCYDQVAKPVDGRSIGGLSCITWKEGKDTNQRRTPIFKGLIVETTGGTGPDFVLRPEDRDGQDIWKMEKQGVVNLLGKRLELWTAPNKEDPEQIKAHIERFKKRNWHNGKVVAINRQWGTTTVFMEFQDIRFPRVHLLSSPKNIPRLSETAGVYFDRLFDLSKSWIETETA